MGAGTVSLAQSPRTQVIENGAEQGQSTGSLLGRLTDLHSNPLEGVLLTLRNQATGAEARATTTKNGVYRFSELEPGEYTLQAESPELGRGQVEAIEVDAGREARVQAAMEFEPFPPSPVLTARGEVRPKVEEQPGMNQPDLKPALPPVSGATLAAHPLQTQPMNGPFGATGEAPAAAAPKANATLAAEPPKTLAQAGASQQLPAPLKPAVPTSALVASIPVAAAPPPASPGEIRSQVPEAKPVAPVPSAIETVPASPHPAVPPPPAAPAPAAKPIPPPPPKPILAASQQTGPELPAGTTAMSAAELQSLPVSGRRWQDFVLDNTPTSVTPAGGQGEISLRGAGHQPPEIAVDGFAKGLAFGSASGTSSSGQGSQGHGPLGQGGEPAGTAQVWAGGHGLAISEAAIRAVETAAGSVEAAADRAAGGRVNEETLRGANELHGQGFLFDRQNTWGARNPFTQRVKETAPATEITTPAFTPESYTPPDRETVWGIGLGSRIRRNKLFWFGALDGYSRKDSGVSTVRNPGVFFGPQKDSLLELLTTRMGLSSNNPLAPGVAEYSSMLETLNGLLGPAPRAAMQWTGFGRLDWEAAERHHFTLESIGAHWNSPGGGLTRVSETYGNHSFGSSEASEEWLLGRWEAFITPNLLAVTQASAGHATQEARPEIPSAFEQTLLAGNSWGQLPQIVVDNRYGFTIGNPSRFGKGSYPDERLYQGQESVDWIRGNLLVKAGFGFDRNFDAIGLLRNQTGTYSYENAINFTSDVWAFENSHSELTPGSEYNCDQAGSGAGNLPCYSHYTQTIGPADWRLSTNDWAGYATAQWQANKLLVVSAGLRWEREQLPPPIAALKNPELPLTEKLPSLGNQWGPRISLAVGTGERHWPVLRLGYGIYFERTANATVETALTQTGSLAGDLSFFLRPTDDLPNYGGGAPPFPYVLAGQPSTVVKPGAVEFAPNFHNPEVHQAVAAVEVTLPGHVEVTASAMASLGRRLPVFIDSNFDPAVTGVITYEVVDSTGKGPIDPAKTPRITVPFYASWPSSTASAADCPIPYTAPYKGWLNPCYQQIDQIMSRANSTYEAGTLKVVRNGRRGLSLRAHYTYAHAMDWNPSESPLDPAADFRQEYGTSNLDVRHSASTMAIYEAPWKLRGRAGKFANGWMLSGIWQFRSGLPYTMRVSGSIPRCAVSAGVTPCATPYAGLNVAIGSSIMGLRPGINGAGGDNRVYGTGSGNIVYNIGRNTFRYPSTWKADLRLGKRFDLGNMRQLELLAESFNLFNHENVTELETTGYSIESGSPFPTLNFLTGLKANTTAFGQPLNINATNFYRERQIQLGLRIRF
jgi:hypothetical protein